MNFKEYNDWIYLIINIIKQKKACYRFLNQVTGF